MHLHASPPLWMPLPGWQKFRPREGMDLFWNNPLVQLIALFYQDGQNLDGQDLSNESMQHHRH